MRFKKIAVLVTVGVLVACAAFMTTGCGEEPVSDVIRVAALNGPTGMGMVGMIEQTDKYEVVSYESPDEITGKIVNGDVDIAAVPSNLAAVLYNRTEGQIKVISPITLGVLYVVENGTSDIKSAEDLKGKTVYASGKGGAPEYILEAVLDEVSLEPSDVNVKWLSNHSDVISSLMKEKGRIAMIPEPFVTVVSMKSENVKASLDMNELWKDAEGKDLPMGVLVAGKDFVEKRADDLDVFMDDCEKSVEFVNDRPKEASQLISKWGFIPDAAVAEKAIPECNIVFYRDAKESREMLDTFYKTLYRMNPKSLGGAYPGDDFYR